MMKKFAVVGALALAAIVMVAWTMGGAQPMRWIEQPVSADDATGGTTPQ